MISMEDWVTIRNLKKKNPALGTRAISKLVGVSRSTVKKALGSEQCPKYSRDKKVNTVIEPFQEYIKEFLQTKGIEVCRMHVGAEAYQVKHNGQTIRFYVQRIIVGSDVKDG